MVGSRWIAKPVIILGNDFLFFMEVTVVAAGQLVAVMVAAASVVVVINPQPVTVSLPDAEHWGLSGAYALFWYPRKPIFVVSFKYEYEEN